MYRNLRSLSIFEKKKSFGERTCLDDGSSPSSCKHLDEQKYLSSHEVATKVSSGLTPAEITRPNKQPRSRSIKSRTVL